MDWITDPQAWIALATLTALEIVLGVDNVVFISILAGKLPAEQQERARRIGLALALVGRVALLLSITWIMKLTTPLFAVFGHDFSGRSLILIAGGLFLLAKATAEIHERIEGGEHRKKTQEAVSFKRVIVQILLLDLVFSLDSVITAVGMAKQVPVMITAVVIAIVFMMFTARMVSDFINRRPTVKILALSFLLMVGLALLAEAFELHIPRGYIYFAMGFSIFVETLNMRVRGSTKHTDISRSAP